MGSDEKAIGNQLVISIWKSRKQIGWDDAIVNLSSGYTLLKGEETI